MSSDPQNIILFIRKIEQDRRIRSIFLPWIDPRSSIRFNLSALDWMPSFCYLIFSSYLYQVIILLDVPLCALDIFQTHYSCVHKSWIRLLLFLQQNSDAYGESNCLLCFVSPTGGSVNCLSKQIRVFTAILRRIDVIPDYDG